MHNRRIGAFLTGALLLGTLLVWFVSSQARVNARSMADALPTPLQREFATVSPDALRMLLMHEAGELSRRIVDAWATVRVGIAGTLLAISVLTHHRSWTAMASSAVLLGLAFTSALYVIPEMHVSGRIVELKPPELTAVEWDALDLARFWHRIVEGACVLTACVLAARLLFDFHLLRSGQDRAASRRTASRL